ncbi:hypothetical protein GLOTRDRAFT_124693 [Gloeophyllum trabeum ATCC 11539]|uniref:Maintenance of telomere capping protein 1 n=1 Tax=Gloeophyllum trabeum (strain ATCC 11539 / FP-39264 / Madison 617) TaxID=670483 RepID=S7QN66_GLOTA|nr:uncharacterized protein GLOTRDRAFT_124693 [Gloeophyllum trabeum ATCC 11539]EPQ60953.1 hypothetical protein GLOTRDRAFT_124693 [Gloeophyllum trabeum ATCC 11539]
MAAKSNSKPEDALQFLDDLDSLPAAPPPAGGKTGSAEPANEGDAAEVLAFLDEITQKSAEPVRTTSHIERPASRASNLERPISRAGTPTLRKSTERVKVGAPSSHLAPAATKGNPSGPSETSAPKGETQQTAQAGAASGSRWGWGSVWSSASAAIQQAKSVVDEQVKHIPLDQTQARKWSEGMIEYAKSAQLDKIGQDFKRVGLSTLNDILNVVAPPISEHEVIQVWLSHDMVGYDGIESLVYRALTRIMDQVEGGDLIVNRGDESRPKDNADTKRDLSAVEGLEAATKLAQANLEELVKRNSAKPPAQSSSIEYPRTYSTVYIRIQPFITTFQLPSSATEEASEPQLQFLLHFTDPSHQLIHTTVTQIVPAKWLELWDQYDWVEDTVAEILRVGVEVIGQEYVIARMGWGNKEIEMPAEEVPQKEP